MHEMGGFREEEVEKVTKEHMKTDYVRMQEKVLEATGVQGWA